MKHREKRYKIPIEVYNKDLTLIITNQVDKSIEKLDKEHGCEYDSSVTYYAVTSTFTGDNGSVAYFITLPEDDLNPDTVAHEALHVVFRLLDQVGIKYSLRNQEPFTYLLEYIVREIHKVIDKQQQKV